MNFIKHWILSRNHNKLAAEIAILEVVRMRIIDQLEMGKTKSLPWRDNDLKEKLRLIDETRLPNMKASLEKIKKDLNM